MLSRSIDIPYYLDVCRILCCLKLGKKILQKIKCFFSILFYFFKKYWNQKTIFVKILYIFFFFKQSQFFYAILSYIIDVISYSYIHVSLLNKDVVKVDVHFDILLDTFEKHNKAIKMRRNMVFLASFINFIGNWRMLRRLMYMFWNFTDQMLPIFLFQ